MEVSHSLPPSPVLTPGGTFDGNGQVWYDLYAADKLILRPILFGIDGLTNSIIADLKWRYSPQWYSLVANSSNVVFDSIDITGRSTSEHEAKNTDGWDTYRSEDITIQNSHIDNGDGKSASASASGGLGGR